jgi:outer membrane protein OmpA-like peptidoglycan-associated protein
VSKLTPVSNFYTYLLSKETTSECGGVETLQKNGEKIMALKSLFNIFLAGAIAMPVMFTDIQSANAAKTLSRNNIVNGLQIQNNKKSRKSASRRNQKQRKRVAKRRAPSSNNQVAVRRAPGSSNKVQQFRAPQQQLRAPSRVNKRRAPPQQQLRAPSRVINRAPAQQLRAPTRVAKRRAPPQQFRAPSPVSKSRAPQKRVVKLRSRAPNRVATRRAPPSSNNSPQFRPPPSQLGVAKSRAPDRIPQQFEQQVVSNDSNFDNQRSIRLEQSSNNQANSASVDLEILFEYNSARINPNSVRQLFILGEALLDPSLANSRILIAGHTDAKGSNNYNVDLSYRRAQAVTDFLTNYTGISSSRLAIEGYGEEQLKYPDAPNSGQNRRVEIINLGS